LLTTAQLPEQDLRLVAFGPDTHGNEDRALEAAFHGPFATFAVATHPPIRAQLRHPDGIYLQDRSHLHPIVARIDPPPKWVLLPK
jgi:hypothetical protein